MPLKDRLLRKLLRPLAWLYYRFFFGGRVSSGSSVVVRALDSATVRWERLSRRADTPLASEEWNAQYLGGRWSFLADPQEAARYGAIAGLARSQGEPSSLLDVGCGEGQLRFHLAKGPEGFYCGVDVSQAAIDRARERVYPGDELLCQDAEVFSPNRRFSAVVLNESLYYFQDPLGQARRYLAMTEQGGVLVVSMFESPRTLAILRHLERHLPLLDSLRLDGRRGSWRLAVFSPGA